MKKVFLVVFLFLVTFIFSPSTSFAQFSSLSQDFNISLDPLMPAPGDTVRVFLSSNEYELNTFKIEWKVDDKTVSSGTGITSINVISPMDRSKNHIVKALITTNGRIVEKTVYVQGRSVAILEQAPTTTVFPGYRGRKTPANEEDLKIVAIPDESFSDLVIFTWDKNYVDGLPEVSGTNNNYFTIPADIFTDFRTVGITLEDLNTRRRVRSYKDIVFGGQNVEFYTFTKNDNPNFHHTSSLFELDKGKLLTSIIAFPFGYNKSILKNPEISWYINGEEVPGYTNKLTLPLKNDNPETSGTADIMVDINPAQSLSQQTIKPFRISY
ncbi:MAG TPA: hypothetical protein VGE63_03320 [Candidatus Paceibacterota bacterium]